MLLKTPQFVKTRPDVRISNIQIRKIKFYVKSDSVSLRAAFVSKSILVLEIECYVSTNKSVVLFLRSKAEGSHDFWL